MKRTLFLLILLVPLAAHAQIITTIAGTGIDGYSGDGGTATAANLNHPSGIVFDGSGNIYLADRLNSRIRKITPSGIITTVAGNGFPGYSGDGGLATDASLCGNLWGIAVDNTGNIYIADENNQRIRKVNTSGIISTFAGTGTFGFSGDGGPATAAQLCGPSSVALDNSGNVYICDQQNHRIRKVDPSGVITTVAGNGMADFSGDGGLATAAALNYPSNVCADNSGNIYIADQSNYRVRIVNSAGIISTFAGTGVHGFSGDGGPATTAALNYPGSVTADAAGNIYIADSRNHRVRKVNTSGVIMTVAGNGNLGYSGDGNMAALAEISSPWGIAIDNSGNLYLGDYLNGRIRKVTPKTNGLDDLQSPGATKAFPNPSTSLLHISTDQPINYIDIINVQGQRVLHFQQPSNLRETQIDISSLPAGSYFVVINNSEVEKIIKR